MGRSSHQCGALIFGGHILDAVLALMVSVFWPGFQPGQCSSVGCGSCHRMRSLLGTIN